MDAPTVGHAPAAVHRALPNSTPALAEKLTVTLFTTDIEHRNLIEDRLRARGVRNTQTSMIIKVALRVAAKAVKEDPGYPLREFVREIEAEDGRRRPRKR
jgi:hypothetical protein